MQTLYQKFKETAIRYPNHFAVGKKNGNHWKAKTYTEFLGVVDAVAGGLANIGINVNDHVAILSENRPEWLASDLALNKLGAVSVTIHATVREKGIEYILQDSQAQYLIISSDLFAKHQLWLKDFATLKKIIIIGGETPNSERLVSFHELRKQNNSCAPNINESGLASIVYTSGTTGDPKGVMLTNKNFLANVAASVAVVPVNQRDRFLSFLPLSHVLERTAGSYVPIFSGAQIVYAESVAKLADNLQEIRPTILVSVPKIFERMEEKILGQVQAKGGLTKKLFYWALSQKQNGWKKSLAEILVFAKVSRAFGGQLRFAISGGASIQPRILRFFKHLGINIVEGYGLTETAPIITVNPLERPKVGTVGKLVPGVKVEIASDKEVLVKGDNVMSGYWGKEVETKEVFNKDGWLLTGDLGFLDSEGYLTIIGRKKDMIVLSNGKNVAPEKIEGLINLTPYFEQSLVVGHKQSYLAALLVLNKAAIQRDFGATVDLEKLAHKELEKINQELPHYEMIKNFQVLDQPFSMEAEELTPTLKLRRKFVEGRYRVVIDKMFI